MHEIAEYGIAAHWAYKEGKQVNRGKDTFEEKLTWFREILEMQSETADAEEFVESLKVDYFSDMVYVFTPKGDVIELPSGSVPIDFAYRIHTEIGNQTVGAKVNGKMEPLDYQLQTGDIVEVMTSKHSYGPSRDWLNITQSSKAKNKIRQFFKKQRREENVSNGREQVYDEIEALGFQPKEVITEKRLQRIFDKFNFTSEADMYAAVGYQGITGALIATRLTDDLRRAREKKEVSGKIKDVIKDVKSKRSRTDLKDGSGVRVEGVDNLLTRMAKCCNPVPGDDIIGYITKGRGVSVHRKDCANIQSETSKERFLTVEWENEQSKSKQYSLDLEISAFDRNGLLNDILQAVAELNTNITRVNGQADRNNMATVEITVLIFNTDHLQRVVDRIKQVKDVYAVKRQVH